MPFVDISMACGKSPEHRHAVSRAVHDALVAEFGMKPEDDFQLIHEFEPGAMVFPREFRGRPRPPAARRSGNRSAAGSTG